MREQALVYRFSMLGNGRVRTSVAAPEDLLPLRDTNLPAPALPSATNLRLKRGTAVPRPGYRAISVDSGGGLTELPAPNADAVNGLHQALWANGATDLFRVTPVGLHRQVGSAWSAVALGGTSWTGGDLDTWSLALVRKAGGGNQMVFCNGVDPVKAYDPTPAFGEPANLSSVFTGARVCLGHRGRGLYLNAIDTVAGTRYQTRVYYSIIGDPTDARPAQPGAGFVDLDDDPYPIEAAMVLNGRIVVYKGSLAGGAIVVGTPTGLVSAPYRWDTLGTQGVSGSSIGVLYPRGIVQVAAGTVFLPAHDGFYLHDGSTGIREVGRDVSEDLIHRTNVNAVRAAFGWYNRTEREVVLGVPVGGSEYASEFWAFNIETGEARPYGPWFYPRTWMTAAPFAVTTDFTWDEVAEAWDDIAEAWDLYGGVSGAATIVFGAEDGFVGESDGSQTTDQGTTIGTTLVLPPITAREQLVRRGRSARELSGSVVFTARGVSIRYRDTGTAWTPLVQVSDDGGSTWNEISSGMSISGGGTGRLLWQHYDLAVPGTWLQFRISGGAGQELHSVFVELTYSGEERHGW